ncbi:MAG: hypothetical protein HYT93_03950 [Parcubacteria group bacterium]|nr:hypothetical protein [Parcubacteria group bacterium]
MYRLLHLKKEGKDMSKWTFKTVRLNPQGVAEFVELTKSQEAKIDRYTQALEVAAKSTVANPSYSHYFVKESIGVLEGAALPAGNIEYGICQALHGEESAVSAFRSHYGRGEHKELVLGIIAGSPGNIATPCGNCRDIMLEDLGTDFEIVSGAADGGLALVVKMSDYLFSDFKTIALEDVPPSVLQRVDLAIEEGALLVNDAYSPPSVHPERRYHALIATHRNSFVGARDVMCEYHPIYALRDAVRQARRRNDPCINFVVIVCEDFGGGAPHVMYKDRQHLVELNLQGELLTGVETNPPVYLVTHKGYEQLTGAWKTSVKEWIPMVFTPRNFGPEFVDFLTNYFKTLGGRR